METSIGARFERTEIRMYHGRKYFIGDSVTSQGERLFRTVACEKMVHSPTVMFAELVWEHIGKFARDMKTGELIRCKMKGGVLLLSFFFKGLSDALRGLTWERRTWYN